MIRLSLIGLLALVGCEPPVACSTIAMASVSLSVVNERGEAVEGVVPPTIWGMVPSPVKHSPPPIFSAGWSRKAPSRSTLKLRDTPHLTRKWKCLPMNVM